MPATSKHGAPRCPRCGYDLSGQVATWTESCPLEGVCTECGLRIGWAATLAPDALAPGWSVEHCRIRRLPIAAFETLLRALIPERYWRSVRLHHPVRPWRLAWWWVAPAFFAWLIAFGVECFDLWRWIASRPPQRRYTPSLEYLLELAWIPIANFSWYGQGDGWATDPVVIGSLGVTAGFVLVAVIARSVRRPRILHRHLVRAALISLAGPSAYVLAGALDEVRMRVVPDAIYFSLLHGPWRIFTLLGISLWFAWFWWAAFRRGFEADRCWPLILAGWCIGVPLSLLAVLAVDAWALTLFA